VPAIVGCLVASSSLAEQCDVQIILVSCLGDVLQARVAGGCKVVSAVSGFRSWRFRHTS